jgi:calcineurin-like phosphoesterase family protein
MNEISNIKWPSLTNGPEKIWFTSDTHWAHKNIKKFCPNTRLGDTIEEHDERLIYEWNASVRPHDRVYHHGDFCFGSAAYAEHVISRLNGQKFLIYGNHDEVILGSAKLRQMFTWVGHYKEVNLPVPIPVPHTKNDKPKMQKVVMFHFPIFEWHKIHRGAFHTYGHVHGDIQLPGRAMDVGIDTRPFDKLMSPWSWEEVYSLLISREIRGHHEIRKDL